MKGISSYRFVPGRYRVKVRRGVSGLGLFALEPIPRGACIVEYTGRTLSREEEYTSKSRYLYGVHAKKTIDGSCRSNLGRYANHSCRPNATYDISDERVFIVARHNIRAGEEIFVSYGMKYWREFIEPRGCRCPKCGEREALPGSPDRASGGPIKKRRGRPARV